MQLRAKNEFVNELKTIAERNTRGIIIRELKGDYKTETTEKQYIDQLRYEQRKEIPIRQTV